MYKQSSLLLASCLFLLTACSQSDEIATDSISITTVSVSSASSAEPVTSNQKNEESTTGSTTTSVSINTTTTSAASQQTTATTAQRVKPAPKSTTKPIDTRDAAMAIDFNALESGPYRESQIKNSWPGVAWANDGQRVEIIAADNDKFLRVAYPKGSVGPSEGGAQWLVEFDDSYDELYLSYKVRFGPNFDFVKGGKLPGLFGGEGNTGGDKPNGKDGWSARMMWRSGGQAVQYLYHPDQPTTYGEDLDWTAASAKEFPTEKWVRVTHQIVMNTPGQKNGVVRGWCDGELALERTDIRFRDVDSFAIDGFYFSTFFGGNSSDWQASKNEYVDFDDFVVSTKPLQ